ncbi:ATP-binding protein [Spongiactinospora sp. TRM90649]|uniref:ATP-binding protein n=1 Tax=Spongiactinospora sp. TRM90649 TaxID=3031114 RepID=UPI0023F7CCFC|nr:ATP-binding protein [Spongiactinospora sp. TRM90649]MDF5751249.1 ATP-binding protein [Spongiactinospora sp. TRM90649]
MPHLTDSPALRRDGLTLVALPNSVQIGRLYTTAVLRGWGYLNQEFLDDAQLVVSELLTNSVQAMRSANGHTPVTARSFIKITLSELRDRMCVEVWDPHPGLPHPGGMPDAESLRGRGLEIVRALALDMGYRVPRDGSTTAGKTVFATLPFP